MDASETLRRHAETVATLSPDATIIPPTIVSGPVTTDGARALADLARLTAGSPALRLGAVIGEGGMGIVREGEQVPLGRMVAVKTLRPNRHDQLAAVNLLREAWITGALEHPNIVPIHYLELDAGAQPVIVMKRVEGVEWSALIRDAEAVRTRFGAIDLLAWNLSILIQVLNALRFAHSRGVIHRDLKPSNVMIGEFGEVYLLDWGIAVSVRADPAGRLPIADATELAGTPCYMAPEMLGPVGGPGLSARTDIYLAGAVLFEIVAGHPPHQGRTAIEVLASIVECKPTLPSAAPPELAGICEQAMHEKPEDRFESAEALQLALRRYLEHRGSAELASRAWERLAKLQAAIAVTAKDASVSREDVYRMFGGCRFGFHEALAAWPDNADAKKGLVAATVAVAQYELASDNPSAAVTLLADAEPDAPPELVAAARLAADAHAARQQHLEEVGAQHDPRVGKRSRALLAGTLAGLFTLFPWLQVLGVVPGGLAHREQLALSVVFTLVCAGAGWWARHTLFRTAINRRLLLCGILLFGSQSLLVAGTWIVGLPTDLDQFLLMFHSAVIAWVATFAVDPWLIPAAIVYTIAFPLAARWFDQRQLLTGITNLVLTVNVVWLWWPSQPTAKSHRDTRA